MDFAPTTQTKIAMTNPTSKFLVAVIFTAVFLGGCAGKAEYSSFDGAKQTPLAQAQVICNGESALAYDRNLEGVFGVMAQIKQREIAYDACMAKHGWNVRRVAAGKKPESIEALHERALRGHPVAQYNLALRHQNGDGVLKDGATAADWFSRAAEQGHSESQSALGQLHLFGIGIPQDYAMAAKWLRLAAEQGDVNAQAIVGLLYAEGKGVPQDHVESEKWLLRAAEQGAANAQNFLGLIYYKGENVQQDYGKSAKWIHRAAEQGHADAQYFLGELYSKGEGVSQDRTEAVKWWRNAAGKGVAKAQFKMGMAYAAGEGVPQNYQEAYIWTSLAATNGDENAAAYRDENAKRLSPGDLSAAQTESVRRQAEIQRRKGE